MGVASIGDPSTLHLNAVMSAERAKVSEGNDDRDTAEDSQKFAVPLLASHSVWRQTSATEARTEQRRQLTPTADASAGAAALGHACRDIKARHLLLDTVVLDGEDGVVVHRDLGDVVRISDAESAPG